MKVERLDLFDFKINLIEREFNLIKRIAVEYDISIESVISIVILDGIRQEINNLERK